MKKPDRRHSKSGFEKKPEQDSHNCGPEQFNLPEVPPPSFHPMWPSAGTLPAKVNSELLTGKRINQVSFGTQFWRLAAYVQTLKDLGWPVRSSPIHHPSKAKPIAEYFYTPDTIMAARAMRECAR